MINTATIVMISYSVVEGGGATVSLSVELDEAVVSDEEGEEEEELVRMVVIVEEAVIWGRPLQVPELEHTIWLNENGLR